VFTFEPKARRTGSLSGPNLSSFASETHGTEVESASADRQPPRSLVRPESWQMLFRSAHRRLIAGQARSNEEVSLHPDRRSDPGTIQGTALVRGDDYGQAMHRFGCRCRAAKMDIQFSAVRLVQNQGNGSLKHADFTRVRSLRQVERRRRRRRDPIGRLAFPVYRSPGVWRGSFLRSPG